jgi:transcriptional regulator with XRE-family HTH domain
MEPGEIIRRRREELGLSQAQLGNRVGISQPAIKKIEAGDSRHSKFLPKIAQVLQIPLGDLDASLSGVVVPPVAGGGARILGERDFPVHASAEGAPGQIIVSAEPVDFTARPAPFIHVRDAYGLFITGTSMEPEYRRGDTALVNPHLPVIPGEVTSSMPRRPARRAPRSNTCAALPPTNGCSVSTTRPTARPRTSRCRAANGNGRTG